MPFSKTESFLSSFFFFLCSHPHISVWQLKRHVKKQLKRSRATWSWETFARVRLLPARADVGWIWPASPRSGPWILKDGILWDLRTEGWVSLENLTLYCLSVLRNHLQSAAQNICPAHLHPTMLSSLFPALSKPQLWGITFIKYCLKDKLSITPLPQQLFRLSSTESWNS